ncbi:hypothetical protein EC973_003273 [Apophysomyces ossiformis]|uniref:Lon protease homolog n=1 Tax=Apophysomyces ossiformis TaxID=679940 RepID=A0A8H7EUM6_9FUNG|nr:hypothetical protein EC973_003273 [Apophysomyces ossiformis]
MIPSTLPILPLAEKVLLPSIVTKLVVSGQEARNMARIARVDSNNTPYIVCVPLNNTPIDKDTIHTQPLPLIAHDSSCPAIRSTEVDLSSLFHFGCVAQVLEIDDSLPDNMVFSVQGICRSRIDDIISNDGALLQASLVHFPEPELTQQQAADVATPVAAFRTLFYEFGTKMRDIGVPDIVLGQFNKLIDKYPISNVANLLLCLTESTFAEKLHVLAITDFKERLEEINLIVSRHLQVLKMSKDIQRNIEAKLDKKRRDFYLRQQKFNAIHPHIGLATPSLLAENSETLFTPTNEDDDDLVALMEQLNRAGLPAHAYTIVQRDVSRLRKLSSSSPESSLLHTYLEWVAGLPWQKKTPDMVDIAAARRQLDADHFGLDQVKRRILEYLSVIKVKRDMSPPILCFVGPPGVGKTTLGRSIASALQRKFHRIALGGVRDEAEIRGHRRTYVGALPGLLIQGMRKCGVTNPVFLLDEIDKIVQGTHHGDPAAALLEVLDPAQNGSFTDHFLNIPFDLSKVLFIATANSLEAIPGPLMDRMEIVMLAGYTFDEKLNIARSHLVPKQVNAHGLTDLIVPDEVILHVAEHYTRESGVRNLDRNIASICRYKCREYADLEEGGKLHQFKRTVQLADVPNILGMEPFENEVVESEDVAGVVTGLAYSQSGNGGILLIEANEMPGRGQLKLTGSLGDVIKESAQIAVSWVKANAFALKLTQSPKEELFRDTDLHIHMPNGAVPKDGPSAGITMVTCIISLLSGHTVPRTTAMTGEITLRGKVRPVGGIKEKVISAHRAGVTRVVLPAGNRRDVLQDVPESVKKSISFVYCKSIWDVVEACFDHQQLGWEPRYASHL